jgi:hypothetical protein
MDGLFGTVFYLSECIHHRIVRSLRRRRSPGWPDHTVQQWPMPSKQRTKRGDSVVERGKRIERDRERRGVRGRHRET